uniref:Uncharacterized protein n=1 Tax=Drosophila pseudoobscura pseudoobscura TaxID=46245 RepID=A0A0R3NXI8_DROPS
MVLLEADNAAVRRDVEAPSTSTPITTAFPTNTSTSTAPVSTNNSVTPLSVLTAVASSKPIFVSRLMASATDVMVRNFILSKLNIDNSAGLVVTKFNFKVKRNISFKMLVPDKHINSLLDPFFWPVHTICHLFTNRPTSPDHRVGILPTPSAPSATTSATSSVAKN